MCKEKQCDNCMWFVDDVLEECSGEDEVCPEWVPCMSDR